MDLALKIKASRSLKDRGTAVKACVLCILLYGLVISNSVSCLVIINSTRHSFYFSGREQPFLTAFFYQIYLSRHGQYILCFMWYPGDQKHDSHQNLCCADQLESVAPAMEQQEQADWVVARWSMSCSWLKEWSTSNLVCFFALVERYRIYKASIGPPCMLVASDLAKAEGKCDKSPEWSKLCSFRPEQSTNLLKDKQSIHRAPEKHLIVVQATSALMQQEQEAAYLPFGPHHQSHAISVYVPCCCGPCRCFSSLYPFAAIQNRRKCFCTKAEVVCRLWQF